jgi:hypothetical protein
MPPNHWQKERQNKIPFGRISTFVTMEAPVVVNPETASKKGVDKSVGGSRCQVWKAADEGSQKPA